MKRAILVLLCVVVLSIFLVAPVAAGSYVTPNTETASGPMGPAPNSGDCFPDGSGFDGPNGPNGSA